jgi:hypothetical protein
MSRLRIGLLIGVIGMVLGVVMFGRPMPPNATTPAFAAAATPTPATLNFTTDCWGFRHCSKLPSTEKCTSTDPDNEAPVNIVALTKTNLKTGATTGVAWVNEDGIQTVFNFSLVDTTLANGGIKATWTETSCIVTGDCPGFTKTNFVGVLGAKSTEFRSISTDSDRSLVCDGVEQ